MAESDDLVKQLRELRDRVEVVESDNSSLQGLVHAYDVTAAELREENEKLRAQLHQTKQVLKVVMDCIDYTNGACGLTEMVGAVLPITVLSKARAISNEV